MRLITKRKIYRAFPELDRFDDGRCERLIRRLRTDVASVRIIFAPVGAFGVTFLLAAALASLTWDACLQVFQSLMDKRTGDLWLITFIIMALVLAPALAGLLTRDIVLGRAVHRALAERLELTRCRGCRYLLMGQRVIDGIIRCPECGRPTTLAELGLHSPEDLIPPDAEQDELPEDLDEPEAELPPAVTDTQHLLKARERTRSESGGAAPQQRRS